MKPMTVLLIALFLSLCTTAQANGLVGKWKSNEEITLASMKTVEDKIPEKTQKPFKYYAQRSGIILAKNFPCKLKMGDCVVVIGKIVS